MAEGTQYKVTIVGEGGDVFDFIGTQVTKTGEKVNDLTDNIGRMGKAFFAFNEISQGIQNLSNHFNEVIQPGLKLETSMKELEAVTGATGEALQQIEDNARQSAKAFGVDAAGSIESYKLILSGLGPELAKTPDALKAMGDNAALLSKQLSGDVAGATDLLVVSMSAFNVSLEDPIAAAQEMTRQMDMMTAAAKAGKAELPNIKAALENIGSSAEVANVSFAETQSAIQVLDKAALRGAQGGTALRNVLSKLSEGRFMSKESKEALLAAGVDINKLSDKSLSLSERLSALHKVQNDGALMTQFWGRENANAGIALLQNTELLDSYTQEIEKGSGATQNFADTVMSSTEEKISRMKATIADWGISLQQATQPIQPFVVMGTGALQTVADLGLAVMGFSVIADTQFYASMKRMATGTWAFIVAQGNAALALAGTALEMGLLAAGEIGMYIAGLVSATAAQWGFNIALDANPLGLIALGIAAVVGAIALLITYWDEITAAIWKFTKFLIKISPFGVIIDTVEKIFPGTKQKVLDFFNGVWEYIKGFWDKIVGLWDDLKGMLGFGTDTKATVEFKTVTEGADYNVGTYQDVQDPMQVFGNTKGKGNNNTAAAGITDGLNSVSGGTAQGEGVRNLIVTIQRVVGIENLHVTQFKEGVNKAGDMVLERLVGATRDYETALSTAK